MTKMDKILIKIKKLGRIKKSEIEIDRMVLFSGESGLGKSYLAILCHYFFHVLVDDKRIDSYLKENGADFNLQRSNFKNTGIAIEIQKSELEKWLAKDAVEYMQYMLDNENLKGEIEVKLPNSVPETITIHYTEQLVGFTENEEPYLLLHTDHLSYRVLNSDNFGESPYSVVLRHQLITLILSSFKAVEDCFVFPPSRGFALSETFNPVSGLYQSYNETLLKLKKATLENDDILNKTLNNLILNILDGRVEFKDNKFTYHSNGEPMPISAAAASVRELAPFELLAEKTNISKDVVLIEEPEAHLHPLKQRLIADVISLMFNAGAHLQITTHSDYFLRRINEFIILNRIKNRINDEKKYYELCETLDINPELVLPIEGISAYILLPNDDGTSRIEKQNLVDGVPFTSFTKAVENSLRMLDKLYDFENNEDC